jgi:hypothetical protein
MKVKLTLLRGGHSKLACIKTLKDECSDLSLKGAKDIVDGFGGVNQFWVDAINPLRLKRKLEETGYIFRVDDFEQQRRKKLVDLVGSDTDRIEVLVDRITMEIIDEAHCSGVITDESIKKAVENGITNIFLDIDDSDMIRRLYTNLFERIKKEEDV